MNLRLADQSAFPGFHSANLIVLQQPLAGDGKILGVSTSRRMRGSAGRFGKDESAMLTRIRRRTTAPCSGEVNEVIGWISNRYRGAQPIF